MARTIPPMEAMAAAAGTLAPNRAVVNVTNAVVAVDITGCSFDRIVAAVTPFLIPLFVGLAVITFVPETVLWLPRLLLK